MTPFLDMGGNLPPCVPQVFDDAYRTAMIDVLATSQLAAFINAHQFHGQPRDRAAGARFTARRLPEAPDPERMVVTNGTQSALTMLMAGLVGRGGVLALEALSYPTMRQFADMLGVTLVGLPLDGEGIVPEAYEAACRAHSVKAVYALPTLQNPTTVTMGVERRLAIAEISRRHGVAIIEDDIYSLLGAGGPPPLSSYAPELSWYILATAKSIAAGLKVAYVVAPSRAEAERRFWPGMRATYWMCAPISAAIATRFIEGDGADRIIRAVAEETRARQALVAEKLAGADVRTRPDSLHVWLMLPDRHQRRDFAERVRALGAGVSPADTYDFGASPVPNAIRFGTGRAAQREDFARGLDAIATVWQQG